MLSRQKRPFGLKLFYTIQIRERRIGQCAISEQPSSGTRLIGCDEHSGPSLYRWTPGEVDAGRGTIRTLVISRLRYHLGVCVRGERGERLQSTNDITGHIVCSYVYFSIRFHLFSLRLFL